MGVIGRRQLLALVVMIVDGHRVRGIFSLRRVFEHGFDGLVVLLLELAWVVGAPHDGGLRVMQGLCGLLILTFSRSQQEV